VYACFGIFITLPSKVSNVFLRHPWKTKFRGKLTLEDEISGEAQYAEKPYSFIKQPRNHPGPDN
jgi:hypothetical protein